jgi:hypothetical protein
LLPEHVEMLTCIKDWEQGAAREQHKAQDFDLEDKFKNLYLDEVGEGSGSGTGSGGTTADTTAGT